jgi:hypothetical protein
MSTEWLAVRSFRHIQDLLSAINTLSIHIKLVQAAIPDNGRAKQAERARQTLISFLEKLENVVRGAEQTNGQPVIGADPRLRELARSFVRARGERKRFRSTLFRDSISQMEALLQSERPKDLPSLLQCLGELRILLEEHLPADTHQLLGEF